MSGMMVSMKDAKDRAGNGGLVIDTQPGLLGPFAFGKTGHCGNVTNGISVAFTDANDDGGRYLIGGVWSREAARSLHAWLGEQISKWDSE